MERNNTDTLTVSKTHFYDLLLFLITAALGEYFL